MDSRTDVIRAIFRKMMMMDHDFCKKIGVPDPSSDPYDKIFVWIPGQTWRAQILLWNPYSGMFVWIPGRA